MPVASTAVPSSMAKRPLANWMGAEKGRKMSSGRGSGREGESVERLRIPDQQLLSQLCVGCDFGEGVNQHSIVGNMCVVGVGPVRSLDATLEEALNHL